MNVGWVTVIGPNAKRCQTTRRNVPDESAPDAMLNGGLGWAPRRTFSMRGRPTPMPEAFNVDELADFLLDAYAKGTYSWLWVDAAGAHPKRVQLMVNPGIPVAIVSDQVDSHEVAKGNESPGAFTETAKDPGA